MKYYSEMLDKLFDTSAQLKIEESDFIAKKKAAEDAEKTKQAQQKQAREALEQSKKQYAAAVESADICVSEAYKVLELAKEDAKKLSEEYIKQLDAIMAPAKKAVADAEAAKFKAIKEFNERFGPYKVNYTGNRAVEEYQRSRTIFDPFQFLDIFLSNN